MTIPSLSAQFVHSLRIEGYGFLHILRSYTLTAIELHLFKALKLFLRTFSAAVNIRFLGIYTAFFIFSREKLIEKIT